MQHNPNRPEDVLKVDIDDDDEEMLTGDDFYDDARYGLQAANQPVFEITDRTRRAFSLLT